MTKQDYLIDELSKVFVNPEALSDQLPILKLAYNEVTMVCDLQTVHSTLMQLRDNTHFDFDVLIDLCVVDYLYYGIDDWQTKSTTESGFSRGVEPQPREPHFRQPSRFAVVYHLLSTQHNHRLRVKVFVDEKVLIVPSVCVIWKTADWFEREAYDLYGILFEGHTDLRRILTDYGFIGHPFRKDFPLSGHVEMRYDASLQQVIYDPVDIVPRISVPKVIRDDNRYMNIDGEKA